MRNVEKRKYTHTKMILLINEVTDFRIGWNDYFTMIQEVSVAQGSPILQFD